jgi:hypothetical protein
VAEDVISQPGGAGTAKDATSKTQQVDRHQPGFEPPQEEKDAVKVWLDRVQRAESNPEFKEWMELLAELRGYVAGTAHKDKTNQKLVRTNMVYATIAAAIPEIYAKNPDIAVTPTDAVPEAQMGNMKKFAQTAEKVVHKMLVEEGRLKRRCKANIRSASTTSIGVLKMTYQKEYRGDPLIIHRIEDTQDQLAKVEALIEQLKKEDDPTELARKRDELRANQKALASRDEVKIFKGFAVDRLKSEDFLLLDESIVEFDEYVDARALGQRTWLTVNQAEQLFQMKMEGATRYGRPRSDDKTANANPENTPAGEMFVCAVEVWDKENGVVRTVVKGMNRWVREPYAPPHASQRWYPFFILAFNVIEGRWRPISDVELLKGLQDEYNTTRTNYADIREKAVPKRIVRKGGGLSEEDVKNITGSGNKDWVAVEGNPTTPISNDVMDLPVQKIDPAAYDTTLINRDMDLVAGRSDASRAAMIKPKTATEAEIMQEAMSTRTAERRDTNEDLMSEMGEAALEIALQDLTRAEAMQLAGEECEWPEAPESVESVFRQVVVRVRAGSTGKPNQAQEREQWGKLLPQISEAMKQVAELRTQGDYRMADAVVELLRETLRRFDEHLDLDAIIPPVERDENGKPLAQQQAAMELVQVKQQVQQLQEELAKCQQDLQKAQSGEQVKIREAELRAEEEGRAAIRKAQEEAIATQRDVQQQEAEAARQSAEKIAQTNADAQRAAIEDERAKRELDAKVSAEENTALLKAATDIIKTEITAAAAARAKDAEAQQGAEQRDLSEQRFGQIIGDLKSTMDGLSKTMAGLTKDSADRTKMIGDHLEALQ